MLKCVHDELSENGKEKNARRSVEKMAELVLEAGSSIK